MLQILQEHFSTGLFALVLTTGLVQISPIKINPWSYILNIIGKALNTDLTKELKKTNEKLDAHIKSDEEEKKKNELERIRDTRQRILRYDADIRRGMKYTTEAWDEILDDIDTYEDYCDKHPDYKNSKAKSAIANIDARYKEALNNNDFI